MNRLNVVRILFLGVFALLVVFYFAKPHGVETNILSAVLKDKTLLELASRGSSRVNVIFEGEDAQEIKEEFWEKLDKTYIKNEDFDGLFEAYQKYPNNFLSAEKYKKLKNKEYEKVAQESLEMLYNPMGVALVPLEKDPFMFFTDYAMWLMEARQPNILSFEFDKNLALSPSLINGEIKKIVKLQGELSTKGDEGTQIYLAGAPIHAYFASSKSIFEINLICILSALMIISLCKFYFKSVKIVVPIGLGIGFGILCGYLAASIFFPSIHILTFVFSTTLLGICLDYFLHCFIEKDFDKILKSLTVSALTTVCAFCVLFLSGIDLLKQIAIFASVGIFSVYALVTLFYPLIRSKINYTAGELKVPKPNVIVVAALCVISIFGLFRLKFNDDIRAMYTPPKKLLRAEKLINTSTPTFAIAEAKDLESLMQKEEELVQAVENLEYIALSKFVPSISRQKENQNLIKGFYQSKLNSYTVFLDASKRKNLLNSGQNGILSVDNFPNKKDFLIGENSSVMILKNFAGLELPQIEGIDYISPAKDISKMLKEARIKCLRLLLPTFLAIYLLLVPIYKPKIALMLVLPPLLGTIFTFGILGVLGLQINLFHVLSAFLIMGFSLDYSIFRLSGVKNSKDALLISCATSAFSFFLLSLTSFKLISSLGLVLALGLVSSYIFSLLLISES